MYTAKQVAELLQVGVDVVKCFVDLGELDAIDVSLRRGKKRRLRIPEDALRKFGAKAGLCASAVYSGA